MIIVLILILIATVAMYGVNRGINKVLGQSAIYAMAARCAGATGKPLVVIGAPNAPGTLNTIFGCGYGCGDLCVDIDGAEGCPNVAQMPIQDWLALQPDNSAVLFESEVIMYVPRDELDHTIDELKRVSGGDLFSSHSNVIDLPKYIETGMPQQVREIDVYRMQCMRVPARRVFIEFPPFADYKWIEFPPAG